VSPSFDIVIVGAGAAGLAAAAELGRAGRSVLVLEARARIGGRIWSLDEPGLPVAVELGAEFIHGRPAPTFSLLKKAGLAAVDSPRVRFVARDGRLEPRSDGPYTEIRRALKRELGALRSRDISVLALLERLRRQGLPEETAMFARRMVEGYEAADPARASARAIAEDWSAGADGHFRPAGGYGAMMRWLLGECEGTGVELRLGSVVRAVRWKRGSVEVAGSSRRARFQARAPRAIITLPLGVLQAPAGAPGAVRFTPALREKRQALEGLRCGAVVKAALRLRAAFWEDLDGGRYRDASFFHDPQAAFPTFWTALPERTPLMIAWAGGPKARRLARASDPEMRCEAVASLQSVFGARAQVARRLDAFRVHDWQRDPYARGAYSYVAVGGEGAREALAASLRGTLYFAGEAADFEGEHGTVAGALRSGKRAARQVIEDD